MADGDFDPRAYLAGLSAHAGRPGDTSNLNPDFASRLAAAIQQARAQGLPIGVMSGFREAGQTGSAYDAGGNSSHTYGLASDVSGLDGANGKITKAWAQIAQANGLHNPYGIGNKAEFNHWQLPPQPLEQTPGVLASLKQAKATGDFGNVWSAYASQPQPASASSPAVAAINRAAPAPGQPAGQAGSIGDHVNFIYNYARQIGLDPNTALGIANREGLRAWSASNPAAGSYVDVSGGKPFSYGDFQLNVHGGLGTEAMRRAGIDPSDPSQWQAADRFAMDWMRKPGGLQSWRSDPVGKAILAGGRPPDMSAMVSQYAAAMAPGAIDPSITARGKAMTPPIVATPPPLPGAPTAVAGAAPPGTTLTSTAVPAAPANPLTRLVGTAQAPSAFAQGIAGIDKAMGGKGLTSTAPGAQDQGGGARQMQTPPMPPPPMARNVAPPGNPQPGGMLQSMAPAMSATLTGYHPQAYGTGLTSMADPLQWGGVSPGQSPFGAAGAQGAAAPIGTSLTSLQQLQMMDPDRFALMYGIGGGMANTGGQGGYG